MNDAASRFFKTGCPRDVNKMWQIVAK